MRGLVFEFFQKQLFKGLASFTEDASTRVIKGSEGFPETLRLWE